MNGRCKTVNINGNPVHIASNMQFKYHFLLLKLFSVQSLYFFSSRFLFFSASYLVITTGTILSSNKPHLKIIILLY